MKSKKSGSKRDSTMDDTMKIDARDYMFKLKKPSTGGTYAHTNVTKELVAERGKVYGHPLDAFCRVATGAEVIGECPDKEVRAALNSIWVKVCRLIQTPDHADSIDDIAGYAETIHMIHAERKRRK